MIKVRFGIGDLDNFEIWMDSEWPVVPRIGEKLIFARRRQPPQVVQRVAYLVDQDDTLVGAMVAFD